MVPDIIVITVNAPENGAEITKNYISVREENKDKLIEGFLGFGITKKFIIMTEKEYKDEIENTKTNRINPNIQK